MKYVLYKDQYKNTLKQCKSEGKDTAQQDISMICLKYDPERKKGIGISQKGKLSESYLGNKINRYYMHNTHM